MFKKLLLIPVVLALTACTSAPVVETVTVTRTKLVPVSMPDHFLENCPVPIPPLPSVYTDATPTKRELLLTEYNEKLLQTVTHCNNTIDTAREWNKKQRQLLAKDQK